MSLLNLFENNKLYPLNHEHKENHKEKYNDQNKKCLTFFDGFVPSYFRNC